MADALDIFMTQEYCLVSLIVAFFSDQTGKCQEESGQRDKYTSFKKWAKKTNNEHGKVRQGKRCPAPPVGRAGTVARQRSGVKGRKKFFSGLRTWENFFAFASLTLDPG